MMWLIASCHVKEFFQRPDTSVQCQRWLASVGTETWRRHRAIRLRLQDLTFKRRRNVQALDKLCVPNPDLNNWISSLSFQLPPEVSRGSFDGQRGKTFWKKRRRWKPVALDAFVRSKQEWTKKLTTIKKIGDLLTRARRLIQLNPWSKRTERGCNLHFHPS